MRRRPVPGTRERDEAMPGDDHSGDGPMPLRRPLRALGDWLVEEVFQNDWDDDSHQNELNHAPAPPMR
ncbi:hypothetical protein GCM10009069_29090 [Algimonas arctica]|uniref:Uncharacterized protein n=1 Tax=Algimonas arctica TaxID=1479486 RepID=A0A8J3G3E4_9PROT|nr:hypothetical protein GCM10009069_29090 [Algimonas arctica]